MHLIDDVDLVARRGGTIGHRIDYFANIGHAGAAGGIHLHHINMTAFHDRRAMFTLSTGINGRATGAIEANTIHPLGNDAGRSGFAGASDSCHHKGLSDTFRLKSIAQGLHHSVLANEIRKGLWAIFPCQNLICWCVCHEGPSNHELMLQAACALVQQTRARMHGIRWSERVG